MGHVPVLGDLNMDLRWLRMGGFPSSILVFAVVFLPLGLSAQTTSDTLTAGESLEI